MSRGASDISFDPPNPSKRLGELKDKAQEVINSSSTLEGRIAPETAKVLGDRLRFLNSYHSNLVEGHKTSILDIEAALQRDFSKDIQKRYVQELCAAHVETETGLMDEVLSNSPENVCGFGFISKKHKTFYDLLPQHHQYAHS